MEHNLRSRLFLNLKAQAAITESRLQVKKILVLELVLSQKSVRYRHPPKGHKRDNLVMTYSALHWSVSWSRLACFRTFNGLGSSGKSCREIGCPIANAESDTDFHRENGQTFLTSHTSLGLTAPGMGPAYPYRIEPSSMGSTTLNINALGS